MEEAKRVRSNKGKTATRRINELITATKEDLHSEELDAKVQKLREAIEKLGVAHDVVLESVTSEEEAAVIGLENWYYDYDKKANVAIRNAGKRKCLENRKDSGARKVKIETLKVPKFDSSPKRSEEP